MDHRASLPYGHIPGEDSKEVGFGIQAAMVRNHMDREGKTPADASTQEPRPQGGAVPLAFQMDHHGHTPGGVARLHLGRGDDRMKDKVHR